MMTQTWAMLVDAYRELNAKRMFWITMAISLVLVAAFAAIGINDKGLTILWYSIELPQITTKVVPADLFYRFVFATIAIPIWLTWGAAILALVSTASIIPDFVAGGAVELSLSKPISRLRLLYTKYATALLFVALQVGVFSLACFLVLGVRGGSWDPKVFLAVPIVLLFFSFLYCVCAAVGLVTRSTIAALMLTIVFWLLVFGVGTTETILLTVKTSNELRQERLAAMVENLRAQHESQRRSAAEGGRELDPAIVSTNDAAVARRERQLADARDSHRRLRTAHSIAFGVKTVLPKTSETVKLLPRYLLSEEEQMRFLPADSDDMPTFSADDVRIPQSRVQARVEREIRSRSLAWVLGTSIAFELAVLGVMGWIFSRRDF